MNELQNTPLSERELEILRLVAQGRSNKEIASVLYISINTVKVHLAKIFQKIGVASRTEATLYAIEHEHVENPNHTLVSPQDPDQESRVELVVPETVTVERAVVKLSLGEIVRKFWWAFVLGLLLLLSFTVAWNQGWIFPKPTPNPLLVAMSEDRWKELAPMSVARANMAVTVYDNKIYVIGGETKDGVTGLTEVYDIATDTWARLPDKPTPVTNAKAVAVGGKIYVPGGILTNQVSFDGIDVFDSTTNSWETIDTSSPEMAAYALESLNGKIFVFGGILNNKITDKVRSYDPETQVWKEETPLPEGRKLASAFRISNEIVILGGFTETSRPQGIEQFTPGVVNQQVASWNKIGDLENTCSNGSGVSLQNEIYWICGNEIWKYDRVQNRWDEAFIGANDIDLSALNGIASTETAIYLMPQGDSQTSLNNKLYYVKMIYMISIPAIIKP